MGSHQQVSIDLNWHQLFGIIPFELLHQKTRGNQEIAQIAQTKQYSEQPIRQAFLRRPAHPSGANLPAHPHVRMLDSAFLMYSSSWPMSCMSMLTSFVMPSRDNVLQKWTQEDLEISPDPLSKPQLGPCL